MKYRLVTNGKQYKIQSKICLVWKDLCDHMGSGSTTHMYDSYEEAEAYLHKLRNPKTDKWVPVPEFMQEGKVKKGGLNDPPTTPRPPPPKGQGGSKCSVCHGKGWLMLKDDINARETCFSCDGKGYKI